MLESVALPVSPPPELAHALATAAGRLGPFGRRLLYFVEVTSTNDVAARLVGRGSAHGDVVLAETQTGGRGRRGRTWFSPAGAGLYVSVVLELADGPAGQAEPAPFLTLMAGVALAEAVRTGSGLPVEIKWPNDLVVSHGDRPHGSQRRGRKVAGILTEVVSVGPRSAVILGFGVNLRESSYPPDVATVATSLEGELGRSVDRHLILVESLVSMARWYERFHLSEREAILSRWADLSPSSRGSLIRWRDGGITRTGITEGLDRDGALLARASNRLERIVGGEVVWL